MVGGCVRDKLLGIANKDVDLEVFGVTPEQVLALYPNADTVGKSFGVIKLGDLDVAFPRRETKLGLGHKGFKIECDPQLSIEAAAARRDFTINAMYLDPLTNELIDPYHGQADLQKRVLRQVSDHFAEDPLRVLRGMQFAARFELTAAPELIEVCRRMTSEGLPKERLFEEWSKLLLKGKKPSLGLNFLREVGWVKYYPELERLIGCEQDPEWHPEGDVWNHTCECVDRMRPNGDIVIAFAVLCHDFGKPDCTRWDPKKQRLRSLGHDTLGVKHAERFLRRLTDDLHILKEVPPLVRDHMTPFALYRDKAGDTAIRRLASRCGRIDRLLEVSHADGLLPEAYDWLQSAAARLATLRAPQKPLVQGRDLLPLGFTSGPAMGRVLKALYEAQLDGHFDTLEGGLKYISKLTP